MKKDVLLVIIASCSLLFFLQIPVSAVVLPPSDPEFPALTIDTVVDAIGSMSQESEVQWELSSEILGANLVYEGDPEPIPIVIPEPPLSPYGEVQSYVSYSEDTQANMGIISYRKDTELDTKPQAGAQYNLQNERLITFTGIDAGTLLSAEEMAMYNVGNCGPVLFTCPFCYGDCSCLNPAFCSRVEAGSDLDMSQVAAHTSGGIRNVNKAGDWINAPNIIPTADEPALAQYLVQVTEMGQGKPSIGSVSTHVKISEGDSRSGIIDLKELMQQLNIEEFRSIKGQINLFEYQMNYESRLESCCDPSNIDFF